MIAPKAERWAMAKLLLFVVALIPLGLLVFWVASDQLGPDPAKTVVLYTGSWALNFLLLALLVSPLRQWLNRPQLIRARRMLGLFCFFYASLHAVCVATYIVGWQWDVFTEELKERPYMLVGFSAWLTLVPLALTSNRFSVKKLGRKWASLHKVVYLSTVLALIHLVWLVRSSYLEAILYTSAAVFLLYWRLPRRLKPRFWGRSEAF
ncbi:MAG: sulfoxide reductase heme-binding subunit YedZ [Bermanella sp.]|jgi:sulfoxide reductase heme-binding subunit YedZ